MTLKECCDEIALWAGRPVATLEDIVDCWPPGWQTAGHQTKIGDKPAVWGGVATRRNGQGQMLAVSGHASMFEAEAFLLLKVLQGGSVV